MIEKIIQRFFEATRNIPSFEGVGQTSKITIDLIDLNKKTRELYIGKPSYNSNNASSSRKSPYNPKRPSSAYGHK